MKEKVEDMTKLEGGGEGGIRETKKECMYRTCDVHDQEANGYHISLKKKKKKMEKVPGCICWYNAKRERLLQVDRK